MKIAWSGSSGICVFLITSNTEVAEEVEGLFYYKMLAWSQRKISKPQLQIMSKNNNIKQWFQPDANIMQKSICSRGQRKTKLCIIAKMLRMQALNCFQKADFSMYVKGDI